MNTDAQVDFPDDCLGGVYTPATLHELMRLVRRMGAKRVYWNYYGNAEDEIFLWGNTGKPAAEHQVATYRALGDPLGVAVRAAHECGMELFAVLKPYETGMSTNYHEGTPEYEQYGRLPVLGGSLHSISRFVHRNPSMRIRRRMDDVPEDVDTMPIASLKLYKASHEPTRIKKHHIRLWTREINRDYQQRDIPFTFTDSVEPALQDVEDYAGMVRVRKGEPTRVLTLSGLNLTDKYTAVTVEIEDGEPDFGNVGTSMIQAFDPSGRRIPATHACPMGCCGTPSNIGNAGADFGTGLSGFFLHLDAPGMFMAIMRGKNEYLPGAVCESYPEVRAFWMEQLEDCLRAGVDGIDVRLESHSAGTEDLLAYGYNAPVIEAYVEKHGPVSSERDIDPAALAEVRGDAYDAFLGEVSRRVREAGKRMMHHVNVEYLRPAPRATRRGAYSWNIHFHWRDWLEKGLLDEVTLRTYQYYPSYVLQDDFSAEVMERANRLGLPVNYVRYVHPHHDPHRMEKPGEFVEEMQLVAKDGRCARFTVYETATLFQSDGREGLVAREDWTTAICNASEG
ncbi:MAG: hypothetical protein HQ559_13250 [Lentisphaerae bacterium]|nr:hypothetical protein [Lentisphaerota bacterium]